METRKQKQKKNHNNYHSHRSNAHVNSSLAGPCCGRLFGWRACVQCALIGNTSALAHFHSYFTPSAVCAKRKRGDRRCLDRTKYKLRAFQSLKSTHIISVPVKRLHLNFPSYSLCSLVLRCAQKNKTKMITSNVLSLGPNGEHIHHPYHARDIGLC